MSEICETPNNQEDKSHQHDASISVSGIVFGVFLGLLCRFVYWISTVGQVKVIYHIHE